MQGLLVGRLTKTVSICLFFGLIDGSAPSAIPYLFVITEVKFVFHRVTLQRAAAGDIHQAPGAWS